MATDRGMGRPRTSASATQTGYDSPPEMDEPLILVVDDNLDAREMSWSTLRIRGFAASNVRRASTPSHRQRRTPSPHPYGRDDAGDGRVGSDSSVEGGPADRRYPRRDAHRSRILRTPRALFRVRGRRVPGKTYPSGSTRRRRSGHSGKEFPRKVTGGSPREVGTCGELYRRPGTQKRTIVRLPAIDPFAAQKARSLIQEALGWGEITGLVKSNDGRPIQGARVSIRGDRVSLTKDVLTRRGGAFTVSLLPPAAYWVSVRSAGFESQKIAVTTTSATLTLEICLRKVHPNED